MWFTNQLSSSHPVYTVLYEVGKEINVQKQKCSSQGRGSMHLINVPFVVQEESHCLDDCNYMVSPGLVQGSRCTANIMQ